MAGGDTRGEKPLASVKEEPGLPTSQMSTQPHPFRSHTGVLERGIGREPLLSSASTQELEAALAARRAKSQSAREQTERDQKKPRLLSGSESGLLGFGTQHVRAVEAEDGVERFDLTGDDDDLMGGGPAPPRPLCESMRHLLRVKKCVCHIPRMKSVLRLPRGFGAFLKALSLCIISRTVRGATWLA